MSFSVTHINFSDAVGGASEVMHNLVQTHRRSGINCTFFSTRPGRTGSKLLGFGIKNKAHLLLK